MTIERIYDTMNIIPRLPWSVVRISVGDAQKSAQSRDFMDSSVRIRAKNATIAPRAKTRTVPKKSHITERTFDDISRTIESILSISTNVTCGPEAARIERFHTSVSLVYCATKYVRGALANSTGSNEKQKNGRNHSRTDSRRLVIVSVISRPERRNVTVSPISTPSRRAKSSSTETSHLVIVSFPLRILFSN